MTLTINLPAIEITDDRATAWVTVTPDSGHLLELPELDALVATAATANALAVDLGRQAISQTIQRAVGTPMTTVGDVTELQQAMDVLYRELALYEQAQQLASRITSRGEVVVSR